MNILINQMKNKYKITKYKYKSKQIQSISIFVTSDKLIITYIMFSGAI